MKLWTAQYRYTGPYRLDITVKGQDPIGKVFAPTWEIVMGHKKGILTDEQYTEAYHQLMVNSYMQNYAVWKEVLSRDQVVIVCFCKAFNFCHRYILAEYFVKCGAEYVGELTQ